jgi:hypothetical protein
MYDGLKLFLKYVCIPIVSTVVDSKERKEGCAMQYQFMGEDHPHASRTIVS